VTPDVDVGAQKFCIKLLVAAPEGMSEIQLRCRDAPQYARWVAGCRLASRGRSLADASFGAEARGVLGREALGETGERRKGREGYWGALGETQGGGVRGNPGIRCRFKGSRRDEVLGVGPSRLLRLDPGTGSITRAWRYSALRQWNVNWDTQQVTLELEGEVTLALWVLSAPCQALHEFLGGYLCLG
ncbi:URP2 protein, partial [Fregata magnificens]|nr:URP2 protein [Fregata magnificens]